MKHKLIFILLPVSLLAQAALFNTGFEEADWRTLWNDYDNNPAGSNDLIADPGPFNTPGNHVMRLRSPAGARGGADLVKVLSSTYTRVYARWYQKWETGYNFSAGCHNGGLHAGNRNYLGSSDNRPTGSDWFSAWLEPCGENRFHFYAYYRGMFMDCANPVGSCWGDHLPCMIGSGYCTKPVYNAPPMPLPPAPVAGQWYCIEIMADAGVATTDTSSVRPQGILNFWVDGVEYGPFENLWLRTSDAIKIGILYLSLFNHDNTHSTEGIMVDEVAVSTNYIGPKAGVERHSPELLSPAALGGKAAVYDLRGRKMQSLEGLPNGLYFIRLPGTNSPVTIKRVVLK